MASSTLLTPIAGFTVKTYKTAAAAYERGGKIPLLVGPARPMEDSSGNPATAVDVVYHSSLVSRALNGTPQHPAKHFIGYLVDLALKNVEEDMGVKIEKELSKITHARFPRKAKRLRGLGKWAGPLCDATIA
eukprot:6458776-Pyramimonas_sp.AAC.1